MTYMRIEDIWSGVTDRSGHVPKAWDCPCEPWVKTDMDVGLRTVRHVEFAGVDLDLEIGPLDEYRGQ